MINSMKVSGFKCFTNSTINFGKATLLLGVNSGGKSTTIQSILLMSISMENERVNLIENKYGLNLNSFEDILNENCADTISIDLKTSDANEIYFQYRPTDYPHIIQTTISGGRTFEMPEIVYLPANRSVAKLQVAGDSSKWYVGNNNQHLAFIVESSKNVKKTSVHLKRNFYVRKDNKLLDIQINDWLQYILPNNEVSAQNIKYSQQYILEFRSRSNSMFTAENVGFGVAFVLPIIVSALTMEEGGILVVENPEIHLHPSAQSNLAVFLATIAASGLQVIIETHSDHIVNGFRKAVLYDTNDLKSNDLVINYFCNEESEKVTSVNINSKAELGNWPIGFMDQAEEDLYELRKLRLNNDKKYAD